MARTVPCGTFNLVVNFAGAEVWGGLAAVVGIRSGFTAAGYRYGKRKEKHVREAGDVTLKRGLTNSGLVWQWLHDARSSGVNGQKNLSITGLDEAGRPVQTWTLRNVLPKKYTGPMLAAKGAGDVAMEELVLTVEGVEVEVA